MAPEEPIIGIPGPKLAEVVSSLQRLGEKALPRVRSKAVYEMYGSQTASGSETRSE